MAPTPIDRLEELEIQRRLSREYGRFICWGSILGGIRPARDQPLRADVWVARVLAGALPAPALVGGWRVARAGARVGGCRACLDPGGLGAEAVDDGAGGFGGCAA